MKPEEVKALMAKALDALADCAGGDNHDAAEALDLIPKLVQAIDEGFADWQVRFARSMGYSDEDLNALGRICRDEHHAWATRNPEYPTPAPWLHMCPEKQDSYIRQAAAVAMAVRLGSTKSEDLGRPDVVAARLRTERDHYREEAAVERDRKEYWKAKALMEEEEGLGRAFRLNEFNRIKYHLEKSGIEP